jgi:uncharacterized protein YkwD
MALGIGLAITAPAVLRLPGGTTLTLGGPDAPGSGVSRDTASLSSSAATGGPSGIGAPSGAADAAGPAGTAGTASATGTAPSPSPRHASLPQATTGLPAGGSPPTRWPATGGSLPPPPPPATSADPPPGPDPTSQLSPDLAAAYESQVLDLTNAQRALAGCAALRPDSRLQTAAIAHSADMKARGYFAHDSPDGVTPWQRIEATGYADPSAENIAMGQPTPQDVVDAWMNSPGHRANILNCSSKAIGVGVQFGADGPWWTQDFGYS